MRHACVVCRTIIPHDASDADHRSPGPGDRQVAHSVHARALGVVRRLRRPPARPGQPGSGRRTGAAARPRRHRRAGGPDRDLADGLGGLAGAGPAAVGPRLPRHVTHDPVARRRLGPGLPQRRAGLGRPLAPGPDRPARGAARPQPAARRPVVHRLRRADAAHLGEPVPAGRARRGARPGRRDRATGPGRPGRVPARSRRGTCRASRRRTNASSRRPTPCSTGSTRTAPPTRTRPRSPPGSASCTSGASSCSPTRACPTTCCPPTGRAGPPRSSSPARPAGSSRPRTGSSRPASTTEQARSGRLRA